MEWHFRCNPAVNAEDWVLELRFAAPARQWRFDFAFPLLRLAVEVDGGTWNNGRHVHGSGFEEDCRKLNTAALAGWTVLRFTGDMVETGEAILAVAEAVRIRRAAVGPRRVTRTDDTPQEDHRAP